MENISEKSPSPSEPFVLTDENYYTPQANSIYLSSSLFKAVYGCPANPFPCESAALQGPPPVSEALLAGGYVDAAFESPAAFENFRTRHEKELRLKSGKGWYQFVKDADRAVQRARMDPVFISYLEGPGIVHQRIFTGEIAGQPFKIKMDAYRPDGFIADLKYVRTAGETYSETLKRRATFIEQYGYDVQGAIYQEITAQNTGKRLPFYIAYITKEDPADYGVVELPQEMLDEALTFVQLSLTARPMSAVRKAPRSCGRRSCTWCRDQRALKGPMNWKEFTARAAS